MIDGASDFVIYSEARVELEDVGEGRQGFYLTHSILGAYIEDANFEIIIASPWGVSPGSDVPCGFVSNAESNSHNQNVLNFVLLLIAERTYKESET